MHEWLEEFAKNFTLMRAEGVIPPEISTIPLPLQYLAVVYTGTVTSHFYMKGKEVLEYSRVLHKVMYNQDKEGMRNIIWDAREVGIKYSWEPSCSRTLNCSQLFLLNRYSS
jgi:hypothetical protein